MKTLQISTRRLMKEFQTLRDCPLRVTDHGEVLGTWTPAALKTVPVALEERARKDSMAAMPITFIDFLHVGRKR